jgi:hypothetical protein
MSALSSSSKITRRLLFYGFVILIVWMILNTYRLIRVERANTRVSMRMGTGEHEVFVALPSGSYYIHFTSEPITFSHSIHNILPALITTQLLRADGGVIAGPYNDERVWFKIEDGDAFRRLRLLVNITKKEECLIYMDLAPSL